MSRVADAPFPTLAPHPIPPGAPVAGWPAGLRIALERLPTPAYTWDDEDLDVTWDDTTPTRTWDAAFIGGGYTDAVCDFRTLSITAGQPDDQGLFGAGELTLTLDNSHGAWSQYSEDGRLVYWAPGRRVAVWAHLDGQDWWLANQYVTDWVENGDAVTVEAADGFSLLARDVAPDWVAGTAGQRARARISAIAAFAHLPDPVVGDQGDVALTVAPSDDSPLDAIRRVALSDGGMVAVDADGRVMYRDRNWPAGRNDQGDTLDVFSDNICTVPAVVWDATFAASDAHLATRVELTNVAGLVAVADAGDLYGRRYPLAHPDPDLWTTQAEGNTLAGVLLTQRSTPRIAVEEFTLHLLDPGQDLWRTAIDRRLGDRIRFLHDYIAAGGGTGTWDLIAVVDTIAHEITPDAWITTIGCTRSVDALPINRWDRTSLAWDQTDPSNLWRY